MAKGTKFDDLAGDAVARIERSRALGEQLALLPDEPHQGDSDKRTRGRAKAASQLAEWLGHQGFQLPQDVIARMAGLAQGEDHLTAAMREAERVLAWAEDGAPSLKGSPAVASMAQRLNLLTGILTVRLRAAEALLPYVAPKVTPDAAPTVVVPIVVAGGQMPGRGRSDLARDVTPGARRIAPPPMPHEMQQDQEVTKPASADPDAAIRTQEVKP